MQTSNPVQIVECHAEGEVGDVIVSGVEPPPGDTLWEQSRWIAKDDRLRRYVLNEPRGGVFRHCNLLVPPKNADADAAFIIMEPVTHLNWALSWFLPNYDQTRAIPGPWAIV